MVLQGVITDREHRISELEEALRESIRITAQREVVMHEQQMKLEHTERVVSNITNNLDCCSLKLTNWCKYYIIL